MATLQLALTRDREPAQYREAIQTSLLICAQTTRVIETLLALARLERADGVEVRQMMVRSLVEEALATCEARLAERGITVETQLADTQILVAPDQLRLVLDNLIDNARMHGDGKHLAITVEPIAPSVGGARIRVANSGSAVAAAEAPRVFERFWRADTARGVGEHAGLGLALVERLVALLGGSLAATSRPASPPGDAGEFVVTLELPEMRDARVQSAPRSSSVAVGSAEVGPPGSRPIVPQ